MNSHELLERLEVTFAAQPAWNPYLREFIGEGTTTWIAQLRWKHDVEVLRIYYTSTVAEKPTPLQLLEVLLSEVKAYEDNPTVEAFCAATNIPVGKGPTEEWGARWHFNIAKRHAEFLRLADPANVPTRGRTLRIDPDPCEVPEDPREVEEPDIPQGGDDDGISF